MKRIVPLLFSFLAIAPIYGQITPLTPAVPDSVYFNAEMVVGMKAEKETILYGWIGRRQINSQPGVWAWLDERFGVLHFDHVQCPRHSPGSFQYGLGCISPASLFQLAQGDSSYSGYVMFRSSVFAPGQREGAANAWSKFVENGKLVIEQDTLLFAEGNKCKNLPGLYPLSFPPPTEDFPIAGWACWEGQDVLFNLNETLGIRVLAPPSYPAPLHSGELTSWQHRTTTGSRVSGRRGCHGASPWMTLTQTPWSKYV